jgi:hypothetical protein
MVQLAKQFVSTRWRPLPQWTAASWCAFYALFLVYALNDRTGYLLIDHVNLVTHESGHLLFGWFGQGLGLWGGTLMQLLVPFLLAVWFFSQRERTGFTFCLFFFFENFLNIARYMADARAMQLPLVSVGGGDIEAGDWTLIFERLGVLDYDTRIAAVVRILGWVGMIAVVIWLWRSRGRAVEDPPRISAADGRGSTLI